MELVGGMFPAPSREIFFLRLISLELNGFKSFADPQKLGFPAGMSAVVGPNGCGKSNIADALAWVLGEQRASLLRGAEMSDVIFAGTAQRKPMGLAEVKLALEMPDPALPGAIKEVVISRRIYRDSGSEYRINGKESRLKDVQDLLLDTGMGTRAYSFIQQGQIDLILSTKPKDRRQLIEEAAGITRYKLRRQEAERRLEETRANLTRLEDILHELGKQLESLRRQAVKARKALELDGEILALKRILLSAKAVDLQRTRERLAEQTDTLEREVASLTAQASEKASEVEALRLRVDEQERAQERRARSVLGIEQRLRLLDQERGFQVERAQEAAAQQAKILERETEILGRLDETGAGVAALEATEGEAAGRLAACEEQLREAEEAVVFAGGHLRRVEEELRQLKIQRAETQKAQAEVNRQRLLLHGQIAQAEARLETLNHEEAVRAPRLEGLLGDAKRLEREQEGLLQVSETAEEAVLIQARNLKDAEDVERAALQALREAEGELDGLERGLRRVVEELALGSADAEERKALEWLRERGPSPAAFSEGLKVEAEALPAVERILGAWLQAVVLTEAQAASVASIPGRLWMAPDDQAPAPEAPEGLRSLSAFVTWRGSARPFGSLLDRVFACTDEAFQGLAGRFPELGFVSDRLQKLPFGPVQLGASAPPVSPLKLQAERDAFLERREAVLSLSETCEGEAKRARGALAEARERAGEGEEQRRAARRALDEAQGRKAAVDHQLEEIRQASERADALWEKLEGEIETLKAQLRVLEDVPHSAEETRIEAALHACEESLRAAQAGLESRREIKHEQARMRDSAWAERDGAQRHLQMAQRGRFDLEAEAKRLAAEREEVQAREAASHLRNGEIETETQTLLQERGVLAGQQTEAQPVLELEQEGLRRQERLARELQQALENARALLQEVLVQAAQIQGSVEALSKEVELALGLQVPEFLAGISAEEREAWEHGELVHQTRLNECQGRRLDLGGVNPLAIQELAEGEERLSFMEQQRQDVLEAMANLEATISEINGTSEERFMEAFSFINAKFQEVFREAFSGGGAHLTLQDPKDLLECGIEITAQPPGKATKSLNLLSGGEKALTAISLLFAIFHYKPSPFCVLDEVDAPLDEANVTRFADMVQRMKEDTQFIVITHQKPTMVASDTLYGVTQEEPGISRLVSVQLQEAEQLV